MTWKSSLARAMRDLKTEEARLARELGEVQQRLSSLGGLVSGGGSSPGKVKKRRNMSAAARAAISRAAKKRWAKYRAEKGAKS